MRRHEYNRPNTESIEGYIEDLSVIADNSVDIVISNCVVNLSPDKPRVLAVVYRIHFSDVYADRRLSWDIRNNGVLWGECLAGALYSIGWISSRLTERRAFLIRGWSGTARRLLLAGIAAS